MDNVIILANSVDPGQIAPESSLVWVYTVFQVGTFLVSKQCLLSLFQDVVNSLQEKLNLKCVQHFNLVLHNMKSHMPGRMTLLQEHETVAEVIICYVTMETVSFKYL